MNEELLAKLREEIESNPDGIYTGKTAKEIAEIINNPIVTEEPIEEKPVEVAKTTQTVVKDAPIFRVIMGVPSAPNTVTEEEVLSVIK